MPYFLKMLLLLLLVSAWFPTRHTAPVTLCTKATSKCPTNKEAWARRAAEYQCNSTELHYICIFGVKNDLVEACSKEFEVRGGEDGCPMVSNCDEGEPVLVHSDEFLPCPENETGCPESDHDKYRITELYKYPACLVHDRSTLITSTSKYVTSERNPTDDVHIQTDLEHVESESASWELIVGLLLGFLCVAVIVVVVVVVVRKYRRPSCCFNNRNREETIELRWSPRRIPKGEKKTRNLQQHLLSHNRDVTNRVPLSPLQRDEICSIEKCFAPVILKEDITYKRRHASNENESRQREIRDPRDLFQKNDRPSRYVFLRGEPAHGKTVFCLYLLHSWCQARRFSRRSSSSNSQMNYEQCMSVFDFVFYVALRHVKSKISVIDMVCSHVFPTNKEHHEKIRKVLQVSKYKCLVILDGLDEWKIKLSDSDNLNYIGMPNVEDLSNTTVFFSSRPSKLDEIKARMDFKDDDLIVDICGLDETAIKTVVSNVLVSYYNKDERFNECTTMLHNITEEMKRAHILPLMKIPLLATASVHLWMDKQQLEGSMTRFYSKLVDMLIKRADRDGRYNDQKLQGSSHGVSSELNLPVTEEVNRSLSKTTLRHFSFLLSLGMLAYRGLTDMNLDLVDKDEIDDSVLEFADSIGLLSYSTAHGSLAGEKIRVVFFHKTVQEYLAAFFVSYSPERHTFCNQLSNIVSIMELSQMVIFASGLSPVLADRVMQSIVQQANNDSDVVIYRETLNYEAYDKINSIFDLKIKCIREAEYEIARMRHRVRGPIQMDIRYHVSDIYLRKSLETETAKIVRDILTKHHQDVASLFMWKVKDDQDTGITDDTLVGYLDRTETLQSFYLTHRRLTEIGRCFSTLRTISLWHCEIRQRDLEAMSRSLENENLRTLGLVHLTPFLEETEQDVGEGAVLFMQCLLQTLPRIPNLTTMEISYLQQKEDRTLLIETLPQLTCLRRIDYCGGFMTCAQGNYDAEDDRQLVKVVLGMTSLSRILLNQIDLGIQTLELTEDMTNLERIGLYYHFNMSANSWMLFLRSLLRVDREFGVILTDTNIDKESVAFIRSRPDFEYVDDEGNDGTNEQNFTRVILAPPF